jgi:helix-turn-helix protein
MISITAKCLLGALVDTNQLRGSNIFTPLYLQFLGWRIWEEEKLDIEQSTAGPEQQVNRKTTSSI